MVQEKIALLGFGDIARRLVPHLSHANVTGVRRSVVENATINSVSEDCRDLAQVENIIREGFDVIVMTFVPTQRSDQGYKEGYVDTVSTVLEALDKQDHQPRLLVFVSSTSVYGQKDASWVDESLVAEPANYSGHRLLEAESLLANSGYPYCSVRFSGIYGPGRGRLIDQVLAKQGSPAEPVVYTNRIHSEDCAGVLAHLIEYSTTNAPAPYYIATDCEPVPIYDVKMWIAKALGFETGHLQVDHSSPSRVFRSSKRCSNQKLLETGYQFRYPTFREGYGALLNES